MMLFQAGGRLATESKAFEPSIYAAGSRTLVAPGLAARQFMPQVIGSPRLSGKTTQVNTLCSYHDRLNQDRPVVQVLCELPKGRHDIPEEQLRELLGRKLIAEPTGSLADILRSSRLLRGTTSRHVLAIINSEALSTSALRWLLAGFRAAHERPALTTELRLQLLVDGSFGVETLTSGPDSDYPLAQSFPREFSEQEQHTFFATRVAELGFRVSMAAGRELWRHTAGDKYLTQAVGRQLATTSTPKRLGRSLFALSARQIEQILEQPMCWRELHTPATDAIAKLVTLTPNDDFRFRRFLKALQERWQTMDPAAKAIAYEGGLVRRNGQTDVVPRAPMLESLIDEAIGRAYDSLAFLRIGFSSSGIAQEDKERADKAVREIVTAAARSQLVTLHTAYGTVLGSGAVRVSAIATDGGRYTGIWTAPTERFKAGAKVWGLLWAADDEPERSRATHLCLFQMAAPSLQQVRN